MQCGVCGKDNPPGARFCDQCGYIFAPDGEPLPVIGVMSSYGNAWRQLWKNFLWLFLIGIIAGLISGPSHAMSNANVVGFIHQQFGFAGAAAAVFFSFAYGILLTSPIRYGVSFAYLQAARNEPLDIRDMFEAFQNYWNAVLAALLVSIIVGIGGVLLIVPGIIFACRLAFTPYLVVDRFMTVTEAIQESWRMTSGHALKVFGIGVLSIPIGIAGLLCCGVGIIISIMWIGLAFASLYHAVSSTNMTPGQEGVPISYHSIQG